MKIIIENGYVVAYSIVGSILNSIEITEIEDFEHFKTNFRSYKLEDDKVVFDDSKVIINNIIDKTIVE